MTETTTDPALVEVVRNGLVSAAAEMHRVLMRTGFSMALTELEDFGISLYDRDLNLVADSPGLASFLGANDWGIQKGVEFVGRENFSEGDIYIMNYPYWSSSHTNDVSLYAPIFHEDELVGFAVILAHWKDIGSSEPWPTVTATNVHQEGILFPSTKIFDGGERVDDVFELIRFNSRLPETVIGDLNAQVAAVNTGKRRISELYERYGVDLVDACIAEVLAHGERQARTGLEALPDGTWAAEDYLDDDGIEDELVKVGVEVTIDGDEMLVDFSDSHETVAGPMNTPVGKIHGVCKLVLKSITTPTEPSNGGHFEPLEVIVPEGTVAHATYPDPCSIPWFANCSMEVVFHALAEGMPERIPASSGGDLCNRNLLTSDPETGKPIQKGGNEGVGWGASPTHDGPNALLFRPGQTCMNTPIEVMESQVPARITEMRLRPDSGGAGRHRGGLGVVHGYRFHNEGEGATTVKKSATEGWGLDGGTPGTRNKVVWYPDTDKEEVTGTARRPMEPGEGYVFHSAGGGGYGDPLDRPPQQVRADVVDGYVTPQAAETEYGVVLTDDFEIDDERTAALRAP